MKYEKTFSYAYGVLTGLILSVVGTAVRLIGEASIFRIGTLFWPLVIGVFFVMLFGVVWVIQKSLHVKGVDDL